MGALSGGFCSCMGGVFYRHVMMGGGFECVRGGLSSILHFIGFLDASILKFKKKNTKHIDYKTAVQYLI